MRLNHLKRDLRFRIQDSRCEKILISRSQPSAFSPQPCESGFTLVEVALVLMLLGALVVFGMTLVGPLTKKLKYNATKEIIQADVDGIEGWSYDGKALPTSGTWATTVRNTKDSWTKDLIYVYDNNLTAVSTGGICGKKTTYITLTTTTATINNAAFLVLSRGDDSDIDTNITGTPVSTGPIASATTITVSDNDIVYWVTLDELRIKAGCKEAQLKILNEEIAAGLRCSSYSATLFAEGGVPFSTGGGYKWCTSGTWPSGIPNPTAGCTAPASCSALANDEGLWTQATNLTIAGTPTQSGAFSLTFFVRDNNDNNAAAANDNCSQKTLVLNINPLARPYRVWNNAGSTKDFMVDLACQNNVANTAEITNSGANLLLNYGEQIDRYAAAGNCNTLESSFTYSQAITADANCDFCVNFDGTDKVCP